jgi:hypothetical protein
MGVTGRPLGRCPAVGRILGGAVDEKSLLEQNVDIQPPRFALKRLPLMLAHTAEIGNVPCLESQFLSLKAVIHAAAASGLAAHEVERHLVSRVLDLGRQAFSLLLRLQGTGDLGEQITRPEGGDAQRLPQTHDRTYRSVFGDFTIPRTCYGSREGQKIVFVPLDNRLQLPQSDYSYLLQEWDAALGCECAFARVAATIQDILGVKQPVDSLEQLNRDMAESVEPFRQERPLPQPQKQGELFVVSDDAKGVVMRRGADEAAKAFGQRGDRANKKRMAIVGAIYSIGRHERTAEEVTEALFRDRRRPGQEEGQRPVPVAKHVWAALSQAADGTLAEPLAAVFSWQKQELDKRNPEAVKEVVCVRDGEPCLCDAKQEHFGGEVVEVLDILPVTPRLWQAAHLFNKEGSAEARQFVRQRVLRVLKGELKGVLKGLRRLATTRRLAARKKKDLHKICRYLANNASRMRYDEYLKKGYPIASGVIEGACRHYIKDRMQGAGMRWSRQGAQAMLDVRSEYLNGDWQAFQTFRIERETQRLYPHRHLLESLQWPLAV